MEESRISISYLVSRISYLISYLVYLELRGCQICLSGVEMAPYSLIWGFKSCYVGLKFVLFAYLA
jgi:hypothetical protein